LPLDPYPPNLLPENKLDQAADFLFWVDKGMTTMISFSGSSDYSVVGKLLRLPLKLIPEGTILPIVQGKLKGKKWIAGSSHHGFWLGT